MMSSENSGEQIGPYRALETIGSGTMASVTLAEQEGPGGFRKKVALKVIKDEFAGDTEFIKLLMREAAIGGMLRHPNIIQTLAFEHYDDSYVLVLEYVEGQTVGELLRSFNGKGLAPGLALDITIQCCRGLAYAHALTDDDGTALTIVHRDLKPANLMRSEHGVVKIMDFGIARATASWAALTAQGVIRGSPSYMSPEQVLGKELDGRSDLFSLGSILYELLVGETLFQGTAVLDVLESVARVEIGHALDKVQNALPGAENVVAKLLAPHPDDRYPSASSASEDLKLLLLEATGVPVSHNKMASRVSSIDDLSGVSDISVLLGRDTVGSGRVQPETALLDKTTVDEAKGKTRSKKRKQSRKKNIPSKSIKSAREEQVEEFIYVETSDEEELFVFEEVDEESSTSAAETAQAAAETNTAAAATSTAVSLSLEPASSDESKARKTSPPPDSDKMPWVSSLEKDFFETGPSSLPPGSMGPDGPEIGANPSETPAEDELLDASMGDSRPPTDAVAKDVLGDSEQTESGPAETGTATTLDLPADDDELWTDSETRATSQELALSMGELDRQAAVREDSLWVDEVSDDLEEAETQPALPTGKALAEKHKARTTGEGAAIQAGTTAEDSMLDTETIPVPAMNTAEQETTPE